MTISVTDTVETIHPVLWHQYATTRRSPTVIHELLGGDVAASISPARPRSSRIRLLFNDAAASLACEQMHQRARVFTITDTEAVSLSMRYVVAGDVQREQVPNHPGVWFIEFEAQEVPL